MSSAISNACDPSATASPDPQQASEDAAAHQLARDIAHSTMLAGPHEIRDAAAHQLARDIARLVQLGLVRL